MPEHQVQLCYVNTFASIWEYNEAVRAGTIDFSPVIGPRCPVCGAMDHGSIAPYYRWVIELFPFRKGRVAIARFRCRKTGRTFSMLPHQLAPYHKYSVASMLTVLLLAQQVHCEDGKGMNRVVAELPGDCDVTPWLLLLWLSVTVRGLRRAHAVLAVGHDLSHIRSRHRRWERLEEVHAYLQPFSGPGPPRASAERLVLHHARRARSFLVGTPSQQRYQCA
jgi:hypothetical protein